MREVVFLQVVISCRRLSKANPSKDASDIEHVSRRNSTRRRSGTSCNTSDMRRDPGKTIPTLALKRVTAILLTHQRKGYMSDASIRGEVATLSDCVQKLTPGSSRNSGESILVPDINVGYIDYANRPRNSVPYRHRNIQRQHSSRGPTADGDTCDARVKKPGEARFSWRKPLAINIRIRNRSP